MQYNFEWDPAKAKDNVRRHRISFERASEIFHDPFMLSTFDDEHSEREDRWITVGKDSSEAIIVVVHTFREIDFEDTNIRIISARKATKRERTDYSLKVKT